MGDAELLTQLGERGIADELRGAAGILDMLSARYIADAQRLVIGAALTLTVPH